jgi:serine/threonine protein phosphatase PrpC
MAFSEIYGIYTILGVADGNGRCGRVIAELTTLLLLEKLQKLIDNKEVPLNKDNVRELVETIDNEICDNPRRIENNSYARSGSTLSACIYNEETNECIIINIGDSKSFIKVNDEMIFQTRAHLPSEAYYKAYPLLRRKCSDKVFKFVYDDKSKSNYVVADSTHSGVEYYHSGRIQKLTPTSVIGHNFLKQSGLLDCIVDVDSIVLPCSDSNSGSSSKSDILIFCASDGYWDVYPENEFNLYGIKYINSHLIINNSSDLAERLVNESLSRWKMDWKVRLSSGYVYPNTYPIPSSEIDDISAAVLRIMV